MILLAVSLFDGEWVKLGLCVLGQMAGCGDRRGGDPIHHRRGGAAGTLNAASE